MGTKGEGCGHLRHGFGKSLTYPRRSSTTSSKQDPKPKGIKAILVLPMNALINSQEQEIERFEMRYLRSFLGAKGPKRMNPPRSSREIEVAQRRPARPSRSPIGSTPDKRVMKRERRSGTNSQTSF